ncbi:FAD-binding oxidoreductase [Prochlorococcus sp. MIT 1341]|uniref:FAD-binding oxidoreductase n=1 Tax=Prochlorococcus sp. MIT 1341 TaxID=3096221 RepID=UPI002A758CFA|nr:FAD-binding oxidoreductase [Prochlorococcus sp. MIT 1341]
MTTPEVFNDLCEELSTCKDIDLLTASSEIERFSKDAYEYSPVLVDSLKDCRAELVVRPQSLDAVKMVASACAIRKVPLTLRGSGTGNYGQCVPLRGGVVMLMGAFSRVESFDQKTGIVKVQPGCLLRDLERFLAIYGRQLRLVPSTWRSASVGGFFAGGSGGIGSVRWGFLRDPGHLISLEIITVERIPKQLHLDAKHAEALNHAYGTNGIVTALSLSTTRAVSWQEVSIDCSDWPEAVDLLLCCSRAAINLNLCSLVEKDIVKHLPNWYGLTSGSHRLLLLVESDSLSTVERLANSKEATFRHLGSEKDQKGAGLKELVWNHTTLHMRAANSDWTYLQMLLPQPELPVMRSLKKRWGNELLWHLEVVRQQGSQRLAALPLVKWRGKEHLEELIANCKELGAVLFNPHVLTVEEGGLGLVDGDQVAAKRRFDPHGLMNPGKLKGWSG